MEEKAIHLRIDVDFHAGLKGGVPFLLDFLETLGAKATFYVVMGPDTLHRHSRRVKSKAFRRRLASLRPWKVLRHLGPAFLASRFLGREVAGGSPEVLREIVRRGHEIGPHGFDHAEWAERCFEMGEEETRRHMERAFSRFRDLLGAPPATWGAPNWRANRHMFARLEEEGIPYSSDVRGCSPFLPEADGRVFRVLQLPITLPCLHELVGHGCPRREIPGILERCLRPGFNLLCLHDYYEGILERDLFMACFRRLDRAGWSFRRLDEAAKRSRNGAVPPGRIETVMVPGGARPVSCQAEFLDRNYFADLEPVPIGGLARVAAGGLGS